MRSNVAPPKQSLISPSGKRYDMEVHDGARETYIFYPDEFGTWRMDGSDKVFIHLPDLPISITFYDCRMLTPAPKPTFYAP